MGEHEPVVWSASGSTIVGRGSVRRVDPGTGPERYHRALQALGDSSSELGFASFTFDHDVPGSIVMIPEEVGPDLGSSDLAPLPPGRVVSDGVAAWTAAFARAMGAIDAGEVEKVVLARRAQVEFEGVPAPLDVAHRLLQSNPGSFLFSVDGLVGASPELLVSLRKGTVSSNPLAGTSSDLAGLEHPRIAREHDLTADWVVSTLAPHLESAAMTRREVADLGPIKHLGTNVSGRVLPGETIADLLASLHPTPAVAGVPADRSVELIRVLEPDGRDRYAGPVGWMTAQGDGEFAVALRCGRLEGRRATLYAGGGLLAGSKQEEELAETSQKLRPMLEALGVEL